jgi:uroporphyrinogen-III synthase
MAHPPRGVAIAPPLAGARVVVTRAERQAEGLVGALGAAGATVAMLPLLAVVPPVDPAPLAHAIARLGSWSWVAFTSANAVRALLAGGGAPWPPSTSVAAVGRATAQALREAGAAPALVAALGRAEGLLEELLPRLRRGERVLLPQAEDARPVLADGLRAAGMEVTTVVAYRKVVPPEATDHAARLFGGGPLGWVTFTSPSTARAFAGLFGERWPERRATLRAASIGPVTSDALRELGVAPTVEAATASDEALAAAIAAAHRA